MTKKKLPIEEQKAIEERLARTQERLKLIENIPYVKYWDNLSLEDLDGEEWKDVDGWVGLYQISNFERVKSFPRKTKVGGDGFKLSKLRILRQQFNNESYRFVGLSNPKRKALIHRLIAEAFIPNTEKLPQVNHINGVRGDNRIINLEWGTRSHDVLHRHRILKHGSYSHYKGIDSPFSKKVVQKDLNGNIIKVWDSQGDVQRDMGYCQSDISSCCTGRHKTSHGFKWEFES